VGGWIVNKSLMVLSAVDVHIFIVLGQERTAGGCMKLGGEKSAVMK
jgi:hypothetical protein